MFDTVTVARIEHEGIDLPCWAHDPDLFFAELPHEVETAKAICDTCPLRRECLSGASTAGSRTASGVASSSFSAPWWRASVPVVGPARSRHDPHPHPSRSPARLDPNPLSAHADGGDPGQAARMTRITG